MYKYTRQEVAELLNISTRSVDRYIKAGKLRSKKDGKVVYVKGSDVEKLKGGSSKQQEVIVPNSGSTKSSSQELARPSDIESSALDTVYKDLREEIKKKDDTIQDLSVKLGRAEEIAKNSVSMIEYKKSQYLLEESKGYLNKEVDVLKDERDMLKNELKYEKNTTLLLIVFVCILIIAAGAILFVKI